MYLVWHDSCLRVHVPIILHANEWRKKKFRKKMLQPVNSDDMFAGVLVWQERIANETKRQW